MTTPIDLPLDPEKSDAFIRSRLEASGIPRPLPSFQFIIDSCQQYERSGDKFVELSRTRFSEIIRAFVNATPFNEELYLLNNPSLRNVNDARRHWLEHGYFEGRLHYGWERFPFDFSKEANEAPESYFLLLHSAALAIQARCYRQAENLFRNAIHIFPRSISARYGFSELMFRLRRPLDSESMLRELLALYPMCRLANELLIEVLVDLGQHDLACSISLSSGYRGNTAQQILRVLGRGCIGLARRQLAKASDDWPVLNRLRERINAEWTEERKKLRHLRNLHRDRSQLTISSKLEIATCLARLGFSVRAMAIIKSLLESEDNKQLLWSDPSKFVVLLNVIMINKGASAAFECITQAPAQVLALPELHSLYFELAHKSGNKVGMAALCSERRNSQNPPKNLETLCYSLIHLRRFSEVLDLARDYWYTVKDNRWLPGVVIQVGRLQNVFSGVSMDDERTEENFSAQIPRKIMQFWDKELIPDDVQKLISLWPVKNPGSDHVLFSKRTAASFLNEVYGDQHVQIFEYCHHPAMAADFFRLAYLCACGGVYIDADEYPNQPLEMLMSAYPSRNLFASISEANFFINNRFLCASPQHPFLDAVLHNVVEDMLSAMKLGIKPDIWTTTGPYQYSRVFAENIIQHTQSSSYLLDRIGLVYTHELTQYFGVQPLQYKTTKEGNWRAL